MFKLLTQKNYEDFILAQKELPRLKELDRREADLANREKQIEHDRKQMQEKFELNEKKVVAALEDKLAKERNELEAQHQKEINDLKADYDRKMVEVEKKSMDKYNRQLEKLTNENYDKLSKSMAKLHEEGNAQTKFVQDLSKDLIGAVAKTMPYNKLQIEENKTITKK